MILSWFALILLSVSGAQSSSEQAHGKAIQLLKQNRLGESLAILERLVATGSSESVLFDYIKVSSDAGEDRRVMNAISRINPASAPGDVLIAIADSYRHTGQLSMASNLYRIVLERDANDPDALAGLALCDAEKGSLSQAQRTLDQLVARFPERVSLHLGLAHLAELTGDLPSRLKHIEKALALDPDHQRALKVFHSKPGPARFSQLDEPAVEIASADESELEQPANPQPEPTNRPVASSPAMDKRDLLRKIQELDPFTASTDDLEDHAWAAVELEQYETAKRLFDLSLNRDPQSVSAQAGGLVSQAGAGDWQAPDQKLERLDQEHPNHTSVLKAQGYLSKIKGDLQAAARFFARASEVRPTATTAEPEPTPAAAASPEKTTPATPKPSRVDNLRVNSKHVQAVKLADEKRYAEALNLLEEIMNPTTPERTMVHDYVLISSKAGQHQRALSQLEHFDPTVAPIPVLESMARSACNEGQFGLAGDMFTNLVEREPQNLGARVAMLLCQAESGKVTAAERSLKRLRREFPRKADPLIGLAAVARMKGDEVSERGYFLRVLEIDSRHKVAKRAIEGPENDVAVRAETLTNQRLGRPFTEVLREKHQNAIDLAHADRLDDSLALLSEVMRLTDEKVVLYDYLVISSWAGKDADVVSRMDRINLTETPVYALEALAKSARNQKRYSMAEQLYREILRRDNEHKQAMAGLDLVEEDLREIREEFAARNQKAETEVAQNDLPDEPEPVLQTTGPDQNEWDNPEAKTRYEKAVELARTERLDESLDMLSDLLYYGDRHPGVIYDYVAVSSWAGHDDKALAQIERIDPETAPVYAVEAIARAARNQREYTLSRDLFGVIMRREPQREDIRINYFLTEAESGNPENAASGLNGLLSETDNKIAVLDALAHTARVSGDAHTEQKIYTRILELDPDNEFAQNALVPVDYVALARKAEHDYAVQLAHENRLRESLDTLSCLIDQSDDPANFRNDYTLIASWAGRDQEVLDQLDQVDLMATPTYVVESMARAARNIGEHGLSRELFRVVTIREPKRLSPQIGKSLSDVDLGNVDTAVTSLNELELNHPRDLELMWALAYTHAARSEYFDELRYYQKILELDPKNIAAKRGRIIATAYIGAPNKALQMLENDTDIGLSPANLEWVLANRAARYVAWGEMTQENKAQPYAQTDVALQMLDANLENNAVHGDNRLKEQLRAQFDRLVALRDRKRMQDAIASFESLKDFHDRIPPYALVAVADAYLHEQRPKEARALYAKALELDPASFNTKLSMYYATSESEIHGEAFELVNQAARFQAAWHRIPGSRVRGENPLKFNADMTAIMAQAYVGRLKNAQHKMEELLIEGPNNPSIRHQLGNLYLWRGWSERSLKQFDIAIALNPENLGARLGRTYNLINLGRYQEVGPLVESLYREFPDEAGVQKVQRDWETRNGFHFSTSSGFSQGPGNNVATNEFKIDSYLYGPSYKTWYKPFVHHHYATADFIEGDIKYRRIGAGLTFEKWKWNASAELHADETDTDNPGFRIGGGYRLNDQWRINASYDSYSNDVPLKGRLSGLEGSTAQAGLSWSSSDLWSISGGYQFHDFNDGNQRQSIGLSTNHGLYAGPKLRLAGTLGVYASRNSEGSRIYFNPKRDLSTSLSLDTILLHYRFYNFKFNHRFVTEYGNYWQDGFGSDWVGTFRYEHQWDITDRIGFQYGASRSRRVYDGNPEYATNFYNTINWRF